MWKRGKQPPDTHLTKKMLCNLLQADETIRVLSEAETVKCCCSIYFQRSQRELVRVHLLVCSPPAR